MARLRGMRMEDVVREMINEKLGDPAKAIVIQTLEWGAGGDVLKVTGKGGEIVERIVVGEVPLSLQLAWLVELVRTIL